MILAKRAIHHICETARIPSFSSYEERLHPYIQRVFRNLQSYRQVEEIPVEGNSLIFRLPSSSRKTVAVTAHLDKINHYGRNHPQELPVNRTENYIEGAMDNCAGLGILLALATHKTEIPDLLFFFSEMEESKGLKEHPELLKNNGEDCEHGMGARRIAGSCIEQNIIPDEVITVDTTPLFKGKPGVALYSKHWELNDLSATDSLIKKTAKVVSDFKDIEPDIHQHNNTNDYLHYGYEFNNGSDKDVISVALEPAIFPYHQKGERVFVDDIKKVVSILKQYLFQQKE